MAPSGGNQGSKNPHMRLVSGKMRFNPNTNVPTNHAGCLIAARSKRDKDAHRAAPRAVKVYTSNAKGMFLCVD